uniref:Uncharacterized protein n=1 Tax=viral metagenome TaxID=1070528 RepID=A0A6C0BWQ3_9ZZZZ
MNDKQKLLLAKYENEVKRPKSSDLGVKSDTRAKLRSLIAKKILDNSQTTRRKYSHSMVSSTNSDNYIKDLNAISALKKLQKERLIISRLGFAEKAYALDKQIEVMREKAKVVRKAEEEKLMAEMLETLHKKNERKQQRLDAVIKQEHDELDASIKKEKDEMIEKHRTEFLKIIENAERKSIGKIKSCNCENDYLCHHNKTSSWNIRKPKPIVILYRKNSKRLKQGGRTEDAIQIEEKADEIDYESQIEWKKNIATSIVQSPWNANEPIIDRTIENHKKELETMEKTHEFKRNAFKERCSRRKFALHNNLITDERRLKIKAKRIYEKQLQEKLRKEGLDDKNEFTDDEYSDDDKDVKYIMNNNRFQRENAQQEKPMATVSFSEGEQNSLINNIKQFNESYYNNNTIHQSFNYSPKTNVMVKFLENDYEPLPKLVSETKYKITQNNVSFSIDADIDMENKTITPIMPTMSKPTHNTFVRQGTIIKEL